MTCHEEECIQVLVVGAGAGPPRNQPRPVAGDAAHVFTPSTGMGLNLAIHDGTVLAQYLAAAISPGNEPETLDLYEQACRPLAKKLLEPDLAPTL